jgi:antirestriction protein ArdC
MNEELDLVRLGDEIELFVTHFNDNKADFSKNVLQKPIVPNDIHQLVSSYVKSKYGFYNDTPDEIKAMSAYKDHVTSLEQNKDNTTTLVINKDVSFDYIDSAALNGCTPAYALQKFKSSLAGHEHTFKNLIKFAEFQNEWRMDIGSGLTYFEPTNLKFTDIHSPDIEWNIENKASSLSLLIQEESAPKMKQEHSDIVFEPGEYKEGKYKKNDIQFSGETEKLFIKIGERLIERLETNDRSGIPLWQDPVFQLNGMNPKTGYVYGNENQVLLIDDTSARGFKAPLYMSFNDAINTGFAMPKGTKGTPIIQRFGMKGKAIETTSESGAVQPVLDTNGEPQHFWRRAAKTVTVFNIDQLEWKHEDKPDPRIKWLAEHTKPQLKALNDEELSTFKESYFKSIDIPVIRGGLQAFYLYHKNEIHLPESKNYKSLLQELLTAFHENAHAEGHFTKLNRKSLNDYHIDDANRGFEELVANIPAQQLIRHYGLDQNEQQQAFHANEDAYNLGWALPAFKKDPLLIVEAMRQAQQCFESMKTRIDAQLKADNVYEVFRKPEPEKVEPAPLATKHSYKKPANDDNKNKSTTKPMRNSL